LEGWEMFGIYWKGFSILEVKFVRRNFSTIKTSNLFFFPDLSSFSYCVPLQRLRFDKVRFFKLCDDSVFKQLIQRMCRDM
jgi:hypothetical protein